MKSRYKYRLVKERAWRFELLPNNSNTQFVAKSSDFITKEEAANAINLLKDFLFNNKLSDIEFKQYKIEKVNGLYKHGAVFEFSKNGYTIATRSYEHRYEVKKGIERIKNNFNANLRNDLEHIVKGKE